MIGTIKILSNMDFWEFHDEIIKIIKLMMPSINYDNIYINYEKVYSRNDDYQYIATIDFGMKTKGYVVVDCTKVFYLGVEKGEEYELWIIFP